MEAKQLTWASLQDAPVCDGHLRSLNCPSNATWARVALCRSSRDGASACVPACVLAMSRGRWQIPSDNEARLSSCSKSIAFRPGAEQEVLRAAQSNRRFQFRISLAVGDQSGTLLADAQTEGALPRRKLPEYSPKDRITYQRELLVESGNGEAVRSDGRTSVHIWLGLLRPLKPRRPPVRDPNARELLGDRKVFAQMLAVEQRCDDRWPRIFIVACERCLDVQSRLAWSASSR